MNRYNFDEEEASGEDLKGVAVTAASVMGLVLFAIISLICTLIAQAVG